MKWFLTIVIFGLCVAISACSEDKKNGVQKLPPLPTIMGDYLSSRGFRKSNDPSLPNVYSIDDVRLSDLARDLDFPITALGQL